MSPAAYKMICTKQAESKETWRQTLRLAISAGSCIELTDLTNIFSLVIVQNTVGQARSPCTLCPPEGAIPANVKLM